jgi:hypothetical protein
MYDDFNFLKKYRSEHFEFSNLSSLSHNVIFCNILTVYCFFIITESFFFFEVLWSYLIGPALKFVLFVSSDAQ